MNPDFLIRFVINKVTGVSNILLTDDTLGAANIKGNFKVTFPDGSLYENSNYTSPDISSIGGIVTIPLKNNSIGEVQLGAYIFDYTVIDTDNDIIDGEKKQFSFSFDEPEIKITNTSDVAIPKVAFSVPFDYTSTDFNENVTRFTISCDFPSTSDASGINKNKSLTNLDREIDMVNVSSYYEGDYTLTADFSAIYQHASLTYLSVSLTIRESSTFPIHAIATTQELLNQIELFKDSESCDKSLYNRVMSLYTNIESGARENTVDEGNVLLSEIYSIIGIAPSTPYQSTPITGLVFTQNDLSNYYTKTEIDALLLGIGGSASLTENIEVSVDGSGIGGFDYLQVATIGTTFTNMWKELLRKATPPTYTIPSLLLSGSNLNTGTRVGEVGVNQSVTITPSFLQNDAGSATQFILNKNASAIVTDVTAPIPNASYADAITPIEGTYTYQGNITHNQGAVKNDDLGNPSPSGQIAAGTINSNNVVYNIVYPWFFGTSSSQSINGANIYSGDKVVEVIGSSIEAAFTGSDVYLWFAVPSLNNNNKTYTSWESTSDANNAGSIGGLTNLFGTPTTLSVTSVGLNSNYTIDYDLYVTNWKTQPLTLNLS